MRRVMPPLNPLRAFEAAGRHVSFTRAAEELNVTQTAVSRQVAVLEGYLRLKLFERHNSDLVLTDTGRNYLLSIQPALDMVSEATEATRGRASSVLKVRVYLTFGLRWLLPRLYRFREAHPNIELSLTTQLQRADFERDDVDVNICHGDGSWPGVVASQIFEDSITPVCHPRLLELDGAPKTPSDLRNQTLLHSRYRDEDWSEWFQFVGADPSHVRGLTLETSSLVYEAAKQGLGFAIGQVRLVQSELARGELVAPFGVMHRAGGYYILHRQGRLEPKSRLFTAWVLEEAAAERAALASAVAA